MGRAGCVSLLCFAVLAAAPSAAPSASGAGWSRRDVHAITQPAPVAGRFVLYASNAGSLQIVALDARTGATAWSAPATAAFVTAGVPASLATEGDDVYYLEPAAGPAGAARLVSRNASNGRVIWRGAVGFLSTWPEICPDDLTSVCVNGVVPNGWGQLRYSAATGQLAGTVPIGSPTEPGREIGLGLFDPETRSPEVFDAVDRGRIVWRRPLSRIFTMPRPSTDAGWDVERIPNLGLFVGSVGSVPAGGIRAKTVDLAVSQTVGFSMRDGHVLWRAKGVYSCAQPFPCPGVSEVGYSSPENADEAGPTVGIALVERGTVSFTKAGSPPKVSNDASATIVGLDPRSGRVEWSFDAGRNVGLMSEDAVPPRVSETAIAIRSGTGRQVALDLRTGRTTPVRSGTKAWCQKAIEYRLAHSTYYSGKAGTYVGELSLFPCDTQGRAASPPAVVPSFVGRIGATLNGLTAWTEAAGVYARRS